MIKIVHIIPNLNKGGAERLVIDICLALKKQKDVEVELITFQEGNEYTFLSEELNSKYIPSHFRPSIFGKSSKDTEALQACIQNFAPDVIHSHLFETEMILTQINCGKAKRIVHFHNKMPQFESLKWSTVLKKANWTNWYEKQCVLRSYARNRTELIAISKDTENFVKTHVSHFNVHLMANAVDLHRFTDNPDSFTSNRIVTIGRLDKNKNHSLAIEVIGELEEQGHTFCLDLIGDGPERQALIDQVNSLNLAKQIHFHGAIDLPEEILGKAFVYLHTAKSEAFGLTLVEAMATGLPVVSTNGGGNAELIMDGENGFCVKDFDAKLLAQKIVLLKENSTKYAEMKSDAKVFASTFSIDRYTDNLLKIYSTPTT